MNREKVLWTPVDGCVKARSHRTAYGIWELWIVSAPQNDTKWRVLRHWPDVSYLHEESPTSGWGVSGDLDRNFQLRYLRQTKGLCRPLVAGLDRAVQPPCRGPGTADVQNLSVGKHAGA